MMAARKAMPLTPSQKMKQLQWDKLPQQQVTKTVFNDEQTELENEWMKKFQMDGVWTEIEEDFRAKQLVINLMGMSFWRQFLAQAGSEYVP
jgi:cytokinesis protein